MTVTFETLAAIYRLAYHLSNVDGKVQQDEIETMVDFYQKFNIDMDTFKKIVNYGEQMGDREALSLVAEMDDEGKQVVSNLFAKVVCSDQELTEEEKSMYFQITDFCGLPDPQDEDEEDEDEDLDDAPEPPAAPTQEDEDDAIVPAFIVASYRGIASVRQTENEDWSALGPEIASWIHADSVDFVHFSAKLNEISKRLRLNGRHLIFMVPKRSDATLGDNMTGTILYGTGYEIMGDIVFALETDKGYEVEGIRSKSLLNEVFNEVNAAVGGLLSVE